MSVGFVSKKLFRILLILGLVSVLLSIPINMIADKPTIVFVNMAMAICFTISLLLLNKGSMLISMHIGMFVTAAGILITLLLDDRGIIWLPAIPLIAFALFGQQQGIRWIIVSFLALLLGLLLDMASSTPVYSIIMLFHTLLVYIVISLIAWFYVRHIEHNHQAILQQRSEKDRLSVAQNLAGGMAHLINNDMQAVIGRAELLKLETRHQAMLDELDHIIRLSTQASGHADQLLAYARGGKYVIQSMDLKVIMMSLLKPWQASLPEYIKVKMQDASFDSHCTGDPVQIAQVLMVLLENAKEAIEDSLKDAAYITLSLEEEVLNKKSRKRNLKAGPYIKILIEDNGCGMGQAIRKRIFEPFYSTRFSGRGMGLAAAYGIIKNHAGHIEVDSQPGKGTLFKVWLPAK